MILLESYLQFIQENISTSIVYSRRKNEIQYEQQLKKYGLNSKEIKNDFEEIGDKIAKGVLKEKDYKNKEDLEKIVKKLSDKLKDISDKKLVKSIILLSLSYGFFSLFDKAVFIVLSFFRVPKADIISRIISTFFVSPVIQNISSGIAKENKLKFTNYIIDLTGIGFFISKSLGNRSFSIIRKIQTILGIILLSFLRKVFSEELEGIFESITEVLQKLFGTLYDVVISILSPFGPIFD